MASINFTPGWTQLSEGEQLRQWRSFLASLDAGDAGFHRYYAELMPRWDRGDVPELIAEERYAADEAEMQTEALWEAMHGFTPDWAYGEPPF